MSEGFVFLFELLDEATILTQGESYATLSLVEATVIAILCDLERERDLSELILGSLCDAVLSSLKARFGGVLRHFVIDVPFDN